MRSLNTRLLAVAGVSFVTLVGAISGCSATTIAVAPSADAALDAVDEVARDAESPDGSVDAGHDARPLAGDIHAAPTAPTSCDKICSDAGLRCEKKAGDEVGSAVFERADGTVCGRAISSCDEVLSPTSRCSQRSSVAVSVTCKCT